MPTRPPRASKKQLIGPSAPLSPLSRSTFVGEDRPAMPRRLAALTLALAAITNAPKSEAFCGFYVAGADTQLYNNATMVVLMREGTRTVLSMQNNYQGPPENFAMVVPVPVVLQKEHVKTLPTAIFDKIDKLAAPRLVEYWEQDPCAPMPPPMPMAAPGAPARASKSRAEAAEPDDLGVKIEAQFTVGEYEVVILSALDSAGLDTWLRQENYKIPEGAEPLLRPYVQAGSKFFVAKVDTQKVRFVDGMAQLSPLRFHYDSETFSLPVRLGLINSKDKQDLIVHVLARGQRYELANYPNVTIPTNIDVDEGAQRQFGSFYAALFDRTLEENRGAVVTEYAWDAGSCDPCPGPTLDASDLATLGSDVLTGEAAAPPLPSPQPNAPSPFLVPNRPRAATESPAVRPPPPRPRPRWMGGFVLTRLHARYGKENLGEDLVFRAAPPIMGGREFMADGGRLETGSRSGGINNFQGRYAIRHAWSGPIACENPRRGIWGGPPAGSAGKGTQAAQNLAFAPRDGVKLASLVRHDVPEIKLRGAPEKLEAVPWAGAVPGGDKPLQGKGSEPSADTKGTSPDVQPAAKTGCGACEVGRAGAPSKGAMFAILFVIGAAFCRRRGH
jgi:hypothetical protein